MSLFYIDISDRGEGQESPRLPLPCIAQFEIKGRSIRIAATSGPSSAPSAEAVRRDFQFNEIAAWIDLPTEALCFDIPFASTTRVFYSRFNNRFVLSNRLGFLSRTDSSVDPRSAYSLLVFGTVAPPLGWWKDVASLSQGSRYRLDLGSLAFHREATPCFSEPPVQGDPGEEARVKELNRVIDDTLIRLCPDRRPIIMFSGGVDSGLLAARAKTLGWEDTLLVNCRLSANDPESDLAQAMAGRLGLRFERMEYQTDGIGDFLDKTIGSYHFPFGDHSALPTAQLVQHIIARHPERSTVLNGVGADGCFGMFSKVKQWSPLYRVPKLLRRTAASFYRRVYTTPSNSEFYLRLLRRADQLPAPLAPLAFSPLDGIGCAFDRLDRTFVQDSILQLADTAGMRIGDRRTVAALDVAIVCANAFAQKDRPLFDGSSVQVHYPFLDPVVLQLAFRSACNWPDAESPKATLKTCLAHHVPSAMVWRKKSGFVSDIGRSLRHGKLLTAVRDLVNNSPMCKFIEPKTISDLYEHIKSGKRLPAQSYTFLWSAVFGHVWTSKMQQGIPDA